MTNLEQIELLKKYKELLLYTANFDMENNEKQAEIEDPPKVLVLKRKFYGKNQKVA